jgi:hypothetical protein
MLMESLLLVSPSRIRSQHACARRRLVHARHQVPGFDHVLKIARERNLKFIQEPDTQFYGMREFAVESPDRSVLTFAEEVKK